VATDTDGKPLFAPRSTQLVTIPFGPRHALQKRLYEEVSEYVIEGYNKAQRGAGAKGSRLLLILIQRLVSSSTRAVSRFLQQRAEVLRGDQTANETPAIALGDLEDDGDIDLDEVAQGALFRVPTSSGELQDVERLLALAMRVEAAGPDARAEALYEHIKRLCQEDGEPSKKVLVFTEFTATQQMLAEFLGQRGYEVALLNGAMDIAERQAALEQFRGDAQVLMSTDAGGEGLNMQFAHVVINVDLPWNPMRVEQRIGRVDRIGQKRAVRALNFVLENSVEARLYDIWQVKLATILAEFGVDKTGDVLDSTVAAAEFEKLARTALLSPDALDHEFDRVVTDIRRAAQQAQETRALFTGKIENADRPPSVPLQAWLRTMQGAEDAHDPLGARTSTCLSG
jgi:SNF2 family DNA or RNA helicase